MEFALQKTYIQFVNRHCSSTTDMLKIIYFSFLQSDKRNTGVSREWDVDARVAPAAAIESIDGYEAAGVRDGHLRPRGAPAPG